MRFIPIVLAAAAIAAASVMDFSVNSDTGEAVPWARVIEQGVPNQLGPWIGTDTEVDEVTAITAGAVGKVSRRYVHEQSGAVVDLWLIVGHMQAVTRHTPNVCYGSAGYKRRESIDRYTFETDGAPEGNEFWTSWFEREDAASTPIRKRVFWAWTLPKPGEPVAWQASDNPRFTYAGQKALFKMYFTTDEPEDNPPLSENPSNEFAAVFLPRLAELLEAGPENFQPAPDAAPAIPTGEEQSG